MTDEAYCSVVLALLQVGADVGADVVLLHGCPQSCMPNPVEGLLEVYEDMVEVWLLY